MPSKGCRDGVRPGHARRPAALGREEAPREEYTHLHPHRNKHRFLHLYIFCICKQSRTSQRPGLTRSRVPCPSSQPGLHRWPGTRQQPRCKLALSLISEDQTETSPRPVAACPDVRPWDVPWHSPGSSGSRSRQTPTLPPRSCLPFRMLPSAPTVFLPEKNKPNRNEIKGAVKCGPGALHLQGCRHLAPLALPEHVGFGWGPGTCGLL